MNALPKPPRGFRHVPGYPGYAVDRHGEVLSCRQGGGTRPRVVDRWHALHPTPVRTGKNKPAYANIIPRVAGRAVLVRVHQFVLWTFRGPCPAGMEGCHKNGRGLDNRLSNLRWGTPSSNNIDKARHGTSNRGEQHPLAKLTARDVLRIRKSRQTGVALGLHYGISAGYVSTIRTRNAWKHI